MIAVNFLMTLVAMALLLIGYANAEEQRVLRFCLIAQVLMLALCVFLKVAE